MVRLVNILLIVILLYQPFFQLFNFVHYCLNKDQIENSFCVNKAKPERRCQGTCHLNKVMNSEGYASEKKAPLPRKVILELNLEYILNHFFISLNTSFDKKSLYSRELRSVCMNGYLKSEFHPPEWII